MEGPADSASGETVDPWHIFSPAPPPPSHFFSAARYRVYPSIGEMQGLSKPVDNTDEVEMDGAKKWDLLVDDRMA